jgi:phosphohistidine phosphatase
MRRLYLLRHAKSSWDEPGLADHDRPLAPRGRRASKLIAEHLEWRGIAPELVLCSSSKRTRQTLSGIAGALGDETEVEFEPDLYAAPASELLDVLHGVSDEVGSVMLIGHNPGIENLTLDLARPGPELARVRHKFPTAALATLEFDVGWRDLGPESCALVSFVKPKELARSA